MLSFMWMAVNDDAFNANTLYVMLCFATLYYAITCYLCHIMLYHAMLVLPMPMLCYVMLCYAMLCYWHQNAMHRSAEFQGPSNAVDLLWSCEGLWRDISFVQDIELSYIFPHKRR